MTAQGRSCAERRAQLEPELNPVQADFTVELTSPDSYLESCLALANRCWSHLGLDEVQRLQDDYNAYPGLERLEPPRSMIVLEDRLTPGLCDRARQAVLEGLIFWEHTAAGEATRLKLGPKYLINPHCLNEPGAAELLPLTLGARHLGQWVFEISRLALEAGLNPAEVLGRQKTLLIVNEQAKAEIFSTIVAADFFGLSPENFLFMVQPAYHGLTPGAGGWHFDSLTPLKLHNHGQMAMQKTMDGQILHLDRQGLPHRLSQADFFRLLHESKDLVSYNIEDLGYLTSALDLEAIGLALELGQEGYQMTMEIVANNPDNPIKGGMCAYDPALGRDVVIESYRLRGLAPARISYLNKNFNHYPNPALIFQKLHEQGLFMAIKVDDGGLYYQPVQGDLNFLGPTAFITRRQLPALSAWKTPHDTEAALKSMRQQDEQPGFKQFISDLVKNLAIDQPTEPL